MKVLVCGGREYDDAQLVDEVLAVLHVKRAITQLIEGGARGADRLGRAWAERQGVEVRTFEADWKRYRYRAGPRRNQQMLDEGKPDVVVAFPGGSGTANMILIASRAGVPVVRPWAESSLAKFLDAL